MPLLYPTACEKSRVFWRVYTLLTIFLCEEVVRRGGGVLRGAAVWLGVLLLASPMGDIGLLLGFIRKLRLALVVCYGFLNEEYRIALVDLIPPRGGA